MTPFTILEGVAAPLLQANVDTDKILPSRFLKTITRQGLGRGLFADLREDPGFILNRAPWDRATILIALDNFGCGSSREHAPWALADFGIRCIIAPGFADIFRNNCLKNGMLPIVIDSTTVVSLASRTADAATATLKVDLVAQTITLSDDRVVTFEIDAQQKAKLVVGRDEIGGTLSMAAVIDAFERRGPGLPAITFG